MRKFLVFLAGAMLLFLLFTTVTTSVIVLTVTPAHIKQWLRTGNVYSSVIDSLTKQGETVVAESGDGNTEADSDQIFAAIKQSVTPQFLQTSTEQLIDGVTPWLEGKIDKPSFSIDVSAVKMSFIQNLTDRARAKYASLPVCSKGQVPDTSDIFNITCQVPGVSIEPQIQEAIQKFNNSKEFLPNSVITPETLNAKDDGQQKPIFDQLHDVPMYYRWAHVAPFILGVLTLITMLIIVLASTEKRRGLRRVMIALGFTGIILLISMWLSVLGVQKAQDHIAKAASDDSVVQNTAIQVIKAVQHDLNNNVLIFAIVFLVMAGGMLVYLLLTRTKGPKTPESKPTSEPETKEKPKEKEPKSAPKPPTLVQIAV